MQTIYKYRLGRENNVPVRIAMVEDAIVLHVDYDPNAKEFCVWAIVITDYVRSESRTFYISGTGMDLTKNLKGDEEMLHIDSFDVDVHREPGHIMGWFHAFEVVSATRK